MRRFCSGWGPASLGVLFLLATVCLSACQATISVAADIRQGGSGSITVRVHLDHDAAAFASDVQTSDLAKIGWKVTGPTPSLDGGVDFTASKGFADPAHAETVMTELSGPAGPFRDLVVDSDNSLFESTTSFRGTVDLTCGVQCFSDPQLQQALGGSANLGIDPSALQADAGIDVNGPFHFQITARLPGKMQTSNAPTQVGNDGTWKAEFGQKVVLLATSRAWNVTHLVMAGVLVVLLLVGSVVALVMLRRRRKGAKLAHKAKKTRRGGGKTVALPTPGRRGGLTVPPAP